MRDAPPDILLLDLKLPGIGGLDVLREARALDPPVLTVMITAFASVTTAVEATRGGTFDFLPKPFTPNEIAACVRRATRDLILSRQARNWRPSNVARVSKSSACWCMN